jgi:5-methylcytosine-specific restriction protein A
MPTVTKIQRPWIKKYDQQEKHDPFYNSTPWRKLRAYILAKDPLCHYCRLIGQVTVATIGDHLKPRRLFPELSLYPDNIVGSCDHHHQVKRNWERTLSTQDQYNERIDAFLKGL